MFAYRLYGLRVDSTIEVRELLACDDGSAADLVVSVLPPADIGANNRTELSNGSVVLTLSDVARFTMTDGSLISVVPALGSTMRDIRLYLLGSAFAAILHQRGLLPIHSNAIVIGGRAAAFVGRSGAGKSTLATWMNDRGHAILSDDVCVIASKVDSDVLVHRGIPRLRLWRDSLEASGRVAEEQDRVADFADKFVLHTGDITVPPSAAIRAFYILSDDHAEGSEAVIARVTGSEAARALIENTYRGSYVRLLGQERTHFGQCADVARRVPVFRLHRPWTLSSLASVCGTLEEHFGSIVIDAYD